MILFIIFTILGIIIGISFFFGHKKFSFTKLLMALWLTSIGVAQLQLSPLEKTWSMTFWFILSLFFTVFLLFNDYFDKLFSKKIRQIKTDININNRILIWLVFILLSFSVAVNLFIYARFGTLPILSSQPDKFRFVINKEVFGLFEYLALAPRIVIPLIFAYLLFGKNKKKWHKVLAILGMIIGLTILSLYMARLMIIFVILFCYFIYLISQINEINWKKILKATIIVGLVVLIIATALPAIRQHITYRDYYYDDDDDAFSYIYSLTQVQLPKQVSFLTPLYIIPAFNLQVLYRATEYYTWPNYLFGKYELSVFDPALRIVGLPETNVKIPWKPIFAYWWITATFLFDYFVDFGIMGIILAGILWASLLNGVYYWAVRKQSLLSFFMFGYLGFVTVMSIYTNYFSRQEFYIDIALLVIISIIITKKSMLHTV